MEGKRLYIYERAMRDHGERVRRSVGKCLEVSIGAKAWCTEGPGETLVRWLVIAAGFGWVIYASFASAQGVYLQEKSAVGAAFTFLWGLFSFGIFGAIYAVIVYLATKYVAALVGTVVLLIATLVWGAVMSLVLAICLTLLLLWTMASALLFVPLRLSHWVWLLYRRIGYRCPYDHCRHTGLPIHVCSCGNQYHDLEPNRYGIFHHVCRHSHLDEESGSVYVEDVRLPALFNRNRLPRLCGGCKRPLLHSSLGELREWPIFLMGGPNAGKTMFLAQAVRRVIAILGRQALGSARIDSEAQRSAHSDQVTLLDRGRVLAKTASGDAAALGLAIRIPTGLHALVYLFDKPGEYFQSMHQFGRLQAIEGLRGAVLLVDPFSLSALEGHAHVEDMRLQPSDIALHNIASNLIHAVEQMLPCGQRLRCDVPLAVVITKVDALPVNLYPFLVGLIGLDHESPDTLSRRCREALCRLGAEDSVRLLEQKFMTLRYFACTATGRFPDPRDVTPFQPAGVEAPLLWLLGGDSFGR